MRFFRILPRWRRVLLNLVALLLPLVLPALAFARAGGGEGYHGSGSHSSGGGSHGHGGGGHGGGGGGGGAGWLWLIFQFVANYPVVAIPLIILAVWLYLWMRRSGGMNEMAPLPRRAPRVNAMQGGPPAQGMGDLFTRDPNFNEALFYQRVKLAFEKIQSAWSAQNLAAVRAFISDGVYERFTLQFADQKAEGWRNVMDNVMVQSISIAELRSDDIYDALSVRIAASAADYRVTLSDGRMIAGSRSPTPFVEVWTFLRRRGAVTTADRAGLIEGNCPNCGAPVAMNQSANCENCKSLLRSGQYDWVLSEITQEEEWQGATSGDLPGVAHLKQRDPDFNIADLEDRASVIFWRKATADRTGKIDPLRKSAADAFCKAYAPFLKPAPDGFRQCFIHCAVGSVQMMGAMSGGEGDRAVVEVRWSGSRAVLAPNTPPRVVEESRTFYSLFVLWRQSTARTDAGKGISSAHCPNCGAPASNSASSACDFCATVLNDGSRGWVLVDVIDRADPRADSVLGELGQAVA